MMWDMSQALAGACKPPLLMMQEDAMPFSKPLLGEQLHHPQPDPVLLLLLLHD